MARVNYQFEKRRRDLEKKKKQEAKQQRKLERKRAQEAGPSVEAGQEGTNSPSPS